MEEAYKERHILEADNNRKSCTCCGKAINKGEKYFRDSMSSFRKSHTVNICRRCVIKMIYYLDIDDVEISEVRKNIILDKLNRGK